MTKLQIIMAIYLTVVFIIWTNCIYKAGIAKGIGKAMEILKDALIEEALKKEMEKMDDE